MKRLVSLFILVFSGFAAAGPLMDSNFFSGSYDRNAPLKRFIVFGDSLSDIGNLYEHLEHKLPASPPYYNGRFCDGPIWIEYLIESYYPVNPLTYLSDYAFGGAAVLPKDFDSEGVFTLASEIQTYLEAHGGKADSNNLYVIWIASNNYLGVPDKMEQALSEANQGIFQSLKHLVAKGARHILVVNLPDLGRLPMSREFGIEDKLSYLSREHNARLGATIKRLKRTHSNVQWLYFDLFSAFNDVLDNPATYGFSTVTDTCHDPQRETSQGAGSDCRGYLFFDPVHPTSPAHKIMADKTRAYLDAAGIKFSG